MSEPLLWLVTACYVWSAGALLYEGKAALAVVFFSYAVANVGLIFAARGG